MSYKKVIDFWFSEIDTSFWFKKDDQFDEQLRSRFSKVHRQARRGELYQWRAQPEGRLAEIIILDQFSRNMFRDLPEAFAFDNLALILAQEAIAIGDDLKLEEAKRTFIYMPFMHSESALMQEKSIELFGKLNEGKNLEYAMRHKEIIDRFGRYPHRNRTLGRKSTPEERSFLTQPGSSF